MEKPKRKGRPPVKRDELDAALRANGGQGLRETLLALSTQGRYLRASVSWADIADDLTERTGVEVSAMNLQRWAQSGAPREEAVCSEG